MAALRQEVLKTHSESSYMVTSPEQRQDYHSRPEKIGVMSNINVRNIVSNRSSIQDQSTICVRKIMQIQDYFSVRSTKNFAS